MPLFKKGNPLGCSNCRLILFSPHTAKYLKNMFYKSVYSFVEKNNLIFKHRFGFRSGYSSNHKNVHLLEGIKMYIGNDTYVCSVFIDLKKAFDTLGSSSELMLIKCGVP